MKNKTFTILSIVLFCSSFTFGQNEEFNLIKLDSTWGQEVLRFPARNINYVGVGDIRFPPKGWINPKHTFFWSYTYAWKVTANKQVTAKELVMNLEKYFNSLNKIELEDTTNKNSATATIFKKKKKKLTTFFEGKVATYDRFATHKRFTLNVKIESSFCKKTQKMCILFTFSPKEFSHKVWKNLNEIELINGVCKN
ncbi:MAG: hypothetical protein AB8B78_10350 [Polaribacter sp.]